jgi:hypothetical protein
MVPMIVPTTPRMRTCFIGWNGASRAVSHAPATLIAKRYDVASSDSLSSIG